MNGTTLLGTLLCAACALGGAAATFTGARFHFGTTVHVPPPPSDAVRPLPQHARFPFKRGVDGPDERRARVPASRHKPSRRRKMRFHCVIISLEGVAARGALVGVRRKW